MFRKGLSFTVFLFLVLVSTASDAVAQTPQELYARGMQAVRQGKYQVAKWHAATDQIHACKSGAIS